MKDENCSPLKLIVSYPSQFCHVCEFFQYCQDLLQLYSVFSSILFGNGLIAHIFFLPPFIHFPVFTFDLFPNQLSFCHQIYFTRKAQCVVFPEVFLFKVCLFLLTWHHAWENILWSYLLYFRTLFHISSSVLWHWILLWRRVWCQHFSFFLLYMIWSFAFENISSSPSELEVSWGWDFLI